ncbi:hypothetical protein [Burkholderia sp. F1]|uniref:hypothetical protein n=1 Tax=Burkholderia sp. F1 TaxID=3366817 RepID=UPI003D762FD9
MARGIVAARPGAATGIGHAVPADAPDGPAGLNRVPFFYDIHPRGLMFNSCRTGSGAFRIRAADTMIVEVEHPARHLGFQAGTAGRLNMPGGRASLASVRYLECNSAT